MVFPSEKFTVTAVLKTKAPVDVDWVDLTLTGRERFTARQGNSSAHKTHNICESRYRLRENVQLPEGVIHLPCELEIPPVSPPSYKSAAVNVHYTVGVRVSVPWWPDARALFQLVVGLRYPVAPPMGKPILAASNAAGPQNKDPYLEASLASDVIIPGALVTGSVSLGNVASNRYQGLSVRVVGTDTPEFRSFGMNDSAVSSISGFTVPVESPDEGESFPLRFRLPKDTAPSHAGRLYRLSYALEIRAERRWASDLSIRVPIMLAAPYASKTDETTRRATAATGSDRLRAVWQRVADEVGLDFDGERIHGRVHGVMLEITRGFSESGIALVAAELEFPSLKLDLSIQGASFGKSGRKGIQLGDAKWDRRHRITAENDDQAGAFLAALDKQLLSFSQVRGDDERLRMVMKNNGTVPQRISELARNVIELAKQLPAARRQVPPPLIFRPHLPGWETLTDDLSGTLDQIRMDVTGSLDGVGASIRHAFASTGGVTRTMITITPPNGLPRDRRFYAQRAAGVCATCGVDYIEEEVCPGCDAALAPRPQIFIGTMPGLVGEDRHIAERASKNAERLEVSTEDICITLLPQPEPTDLLQRVRQLVRLSKVLAISSGPYR